MRPYALFTVALFAGCAQSAELIVEIHSDLEPGIEFDATEVSVDGAARRETARAVGYLDRGVRSLPRTVTPGAHRIRVALLDGDRVVLAREIDRTVSGSQLLPVWLVRLCAETTCDRPRQCDGGRCVERDCVAGEACAEPACDLDSECALPSAPCRVPRCTEGICELVPATGPAGCAATEYCDVELGCVPRSGGSDAGPPRDTGPSDGGSGDVGSGDVGPGDAGAPSDIGADTPGCGSCDDGNPCTDDGCAAGACTHTANGAPCSDGNACTHSDHCSGGSCSGTSYSCTPPACMTSTCDGSGGCSVGGGCGAGSVCDGSGCVACGGVDQRCCGGGGCTSGLWCFTGVCTCGQAGGPCCPWDGSCAVGTCAGGTCPSCYPYGTACDGRLGCCSGLCRGGVCLD